VRFERALAGRRTLRWIDSFQPDVVVSTYSFATLVLGQLKEEGRVTAPTVNFLTDFAVHPRAVHPAIDLNLTVHPEAAALARQLVDAPVVAAGPAVHPKFRAAAEDRAAARSRLGFEPDERVVLVAAGSWGIATALRDTVQALCRDGRFRVVTLCGTDRRLERKLTRQQLGTPVGWTDHVEDYVAAADVVIENAGGLTSLEAFAAGVPVISYRPIPGHGRDNVAVMARAGVTRAPADIDALLREVDALTSREDALEVATATTAPMFEGDPVSQILELMSRTRSSVAVA
jgi:UDP-N-acetylglucosamine:LPS N-acetylglucosamine transferase